MGKLVTRQQKAVSTEQRTPLDDAAAATATASPASAALAKTSTKGHSTGMWNRFSLLWNRFRKRRIESAKEVIRAERELLQEMEVLQRTRARYQDVAFDIEAERHMRRDQYLASTLGREIELEEKRLKLEQLKLEQLKLSRAAHADPPNDAGEDNYKDTLQAAMRRADFEMAMRIVQAKKLFKMRAELIKERDRMIAEIVKDVVSLTPEQEAEISHIRGFFQQIIGEIEAGAGAFPESMER